MRKRFHIREAVCASARTGEGLDFLKSKLAAMLGKGVSDGAGARFRVNLRQWALLNEAEAALGRASGAAPGLGMEFVSMQSMRCAICLNASADPESRCATCNALLNEAPHRELFGIYYLLGQVTKWEEEGRLPTAQISGLRSRYEQRREEVKTSLLPPKLPEIRILEEPPPIPRPVVLPRPVSIATPPPPKPPFSWKNLLTEQNIRWILNLGIFIFSVGLAVFIHTQWTGMPPTLQASILFGASFAAMGAGHVMRRTMLKATGMALVVLGAIAIPIDCAALLKFGLIPQRFESQVGFGGSLLSLGVYAFLAWHSSEVLFTYLGTLAATSAWAFALRLCGVEWPCVPPLLMPFALVMMILSRRPVRLAAAWIAAGSLLLTVGLQCAERLTPQRHFVSLEIAFASAVAAAGWARRRRKHPSFAWMALALLVAMFGIATAHFRLEFHECWMLLALLGAGFGLGWKWKSPPFIVGSVVAGMVALPACDFNFERMAVVLAIPAALHAACGFSKSDDRHAFVGWFLGGLALATALKAREVPDLWQPLVFAGYGVLMMAMARRWTREAFHYLAALAAGMAMFLLALWYPRYFRFAPAPAGQLSQILGAAIAVVSAFAFGPLANRIRSRFVSDITYGCIGFGYILALRFAGVPGKWLGLSVALFGVAYMLLEKRISRWLLRPTLFTGIACTVAASVFAFLQWQVWREYLQSSLTFLLIGAFYLVVAQATPHKWVSHIGTYIAAAGWLVGLRLEALHLPIYTHSLWILLPAGAGMVIAGRRKDLHLGISNLVVAMAALAFVYLDPAMYEKERLPITIAASLAAAALAGWFAFSKPAIEQVDVRLTSGLMGLFASGAYILWLRYLSTGSPWGGLVVFAMTLVLAAAAEGLRWGGWARQAWPLGVVSFLTTAVALSTAHARGTPQGVHLWIYGLALALYTGLGYSFRRTEFSWAGAVSGIVGLFFWLAFWETPWIGVWTFPLAAFVLRRRDRPLLTFGIFAAVLCPLHAAAHLWHLPAAGLAFVAMALLLALTRADALSLYTLALGCVISFAHAPWNSVVLFSGFALYLGLALARRRPLYVHVALVLALLGDYTLAMQFENHAGLFAFPLALVLFGMAFELTKKFGPGYGRPLLAASFGAALLSTAFALGHPTDRIVVFFGDAALFGISAVLFKRPELMYPCSAALVALDIALMARFDIPPRHIAFQLLTLSLGKIILVRTLGERARNYLQPIFIAALVVAVGVLGFGVWNYPAYIDPRGDINVALWGLLLTALIFGSAGRIRRIPALIYFGASNLLGAYYLTLHKYDIETLEFYTVPIAAGLAVWSALAVREKRLRALVESLAAAFFFLPSAALSFVPEKQAHTPAALALAFLTVLAGMGMKRRVFLFGGTGLFIAEVLGKSLQFLIERRLSFAEWGMLAGGFIILVAALFESRKAVIVRERLKLLRAGADKYFASWE